MSEVLRLIKEATAQKAAQEKPKGLRVAAYCRVSTDSDEQKTSYRTQKAFYTDMIQRHPGWTFAGIYADEGITGTSRLHRDEFNQMLEDARNGEIDLIVTKSILKKVENIIEPKVIQLFGEGGAPMPVQSHVDGAKFAAFIDEAVADSIRELEVREDDMSGVSIAVLQNVEGKSMVETMSPEFVNFIGDEYRSLKYTNHLEKP